MRAEAYSMMQPEPSGRALAASIIDAMDDSRCGPDEVDYINAHGTATPANDRVETAAVKRALGRRAYDVPMSSTKSMSGHMLAASGAAEIACCALAIRDGTVPPTINLTDPDPDCDLDYVPGSARSAALRAVLSLSVGLGGHLATVLLRRVAKGARPPAYR
jgi:3-oxoacyl-(acyl-carrier-protein) synthase